jgi:hypothetical protein
MRSHSTLSLISALASLALAACTASAPEPTAEVGVTVHSTSGDPLHTTFVGPASQAADFQLALRDELSGQQSIAEASLFLSLSGPDDTLQITPIDPAVALQLQATIDAVAVAFDYEGSALAVDAQLKDDGSGKAPDYFTKPVQCCKKICPDSYPQAGICDYVCSDTGCGGGSSGGGGGSGGGGSSGGGGGDTSVCHALCYAPTIGPCFDSIFTDWNPACTTCKGTFCVF